jgi:ATP-dependent Clp protease ATP-binding subunit ClpB
LKRALQQIIENPLAEEVLNGKYAPGDVVTASLVGDEVVFD